MPLAAPELASHVGHDDPHSVVPRGSPGVEGAVLRRSLCHAARHYFHVQRSSSHASTKVSQRTRAMSGRWNPQPACHVTVVPTRFRLHGAEGTILRLNNVPVLSEEK